MTGSYETYIFWGEIFHKFGYKLVKIDSGIIQYKNNKNKIRGDVRVTINFYRTIINIEYIRKGYWCSVDTSFNGDNIQEILFVLEALTHPDLLPLCVSIPWAQEMVAYFFESL